MDEKLDYLIRSNDPSPQRLQEAFARYAELLLLYPSHQIIAHYSHLLSDLFHHVPSSFAKGVYCSMKGLDHFVQGEYHDGERYFEKALDILKDSGKTDMLGMTRLLYGANQRSLGVFDQAVKHLLYSVSVMSSGDFLLYKALAHYQLAEINMYIKDYVAAKYHYDKNIVLAKKSKHLEGLFRGYVGMANFYLLQNDLENCKTYLDIASSLGKLTPAQEGRLLCDLGIYYYRKKDFPSAEQYLTQSCELRKEVSLINAYATSLIHLSQTYLAQDRWQEALTHLTTAFDICQESEAKSKLMDCHSLLAETHQLLENWEASAKHYQAYIAIKNELTEKQLQNIYSLKNEQIEKQRKLLEIAHKRTTDSINYAKRIQEAILPSANKLNACFEDAFVFYQPKDIVAGDFYWIEKIGAKRIVAVADCTGHGVPGAMLSVLCSNALNRAVKEENLLEAHQILNRVREIIVEKFASPDHSIKDGMDIALCVIEGNAVNFAGAYRPLWVIRNQQLIELKGDKQPIGKSDYYRPYTSHHLNLKEGDALYLFSDGYVDQFGGIENKKFMKRNFLSLLVRLQNEPMEAQAKAIETAFQQWKDNQRQIDDVCVFGARF